MKRQSRTIAAMAVAVACSVQAAPTSAAPAASCQASDYSIALDLFLPLAADGSGRAAASGMRGSLAIHHMRVGKDRRRWPLDGRQPSQMWNFGNDFRLRLMLAPGDDLVDLVIETQVRQGLGTHIGTFRLETSEGVKVQGRIECTVG